MLSQNLNFAWLPRAIDQLLAGAAVTVSLTGFAVLFGTALAVVGAYGKTNGPRWLRWPIGAYVEVFRNTPFLAQLYFFFFALPSMGVFLRPDQAALLGMSLNLGAYATDVIRAGIEAVPRGQIEAGTALGLTRFQIFRLVVFVPALQTIYPPLSGQFTTLLLGSSVTAAISNEELTSAANVISSLTFRTIEVYMVVAAIYVVIVLALRIVLALVYNLFLRDPLRPGMRLV